MFSSVFVFDPTISDEQSRRRGIGRYLQILKENFPDWSFINFTNFKNFKNSVFINPFFNFLQAPLIMKRIAQKQIAVIHDLIPLKYPKHFPSGIKGKLNIFLNKLALRNYDLIITDSQASKKDIVQILRVNEKKVKVIYPCLPKIFINSNFQIPNNQSPLFSTKFCLYVGDATWNKNLVNLAKAIKIINVTCVFVGKVFKITQNSAKREKQKKSRQKMAKNADLRKCHAWLPTIDTQSTFTSLMHFRKDAFEPKNHPWQQEFNQFLHEVKDDKRFIFTGFVDDYRLIKLYQQARVNILVSRDEGFGFSYLEAASQGCPSVISQIPVLKEIADETAWFAKPEDPYDIANKIGEIFFNDRLKKKLGEKAKKNSLKFNQKKFKESFIKILK